jgi:ribosomal protein L37E
MKINQTIKDEIAKKLNEKKAVLPCQRCGQSNFSLLDGFANIPLNKEVSGNVVIGGPSVPCAVIACNNCGNISYHALGALGMLNKEKED